MRGFHLNKMPQTNVNYDRIFESELRWRIHRVYRLPHSFFLYLSTPIVA